MVYDLRPRPTPRTAHVTERVTPAEHALLSSVAAALERAEITKPVTLHSLRHTYTAARLQTTDHGAPVSVYTVMKELGHRSIGLIESTYGHLTNIRHRSAVVEYRRTEVVDLGARRAESA